MAAAVTWASAAAQRPSWSLGKWPRGWVEGVQGDQVQSPEPYIEQEPLRVYTQHSLTIPSTAQTGVHVGCTPLWPGELQGLGAELSAYPPRSRPGVALRTTRGQKCTTREISVAHWAIAALVAPLVFGGAQTLAGCYLPAPDLWYVEGLVFAAMVLLKIR